MRLFLTSLFVYTQPPSWRSRFDKHTREALLAALLEYGCVLFFLLLRSMNYQATVSLIESIDSTTPAKTTPAKHWYGELSATWTSPCLLVQRERCLFPPNSSPYWTRNDKNELMILWTMLGRLVCFSPFASPHPSPLACLGQQCRCRLL